MYHRLPVLGLLLTTTMLAAQRPDTTGWMQRSDIKAVRAIILQLDSSMLAGALHKRDTTAICPRAADFAIAVHTDSAHLVRRIQLEGGTDDSAHLFIYYYDEQGRLRFTFAKRSAVNGTHAEERIYYDDTGGVLHRDVRRIAGPGWPWDSVEAITNPEAWLRNPCE